MTKFQKFFPPIYILLVVLGFLYIRAVLKEGDIAVNSKIKQTTTESHPSVVYLNVESAGGTTEYRARLRTIDSVNELLEDLHKNQGFNYEKIAYLDHTDIDFVNGKQAPQGYTWNLYEGDQNITSVIDSTYLKDDQVYTFRLTQTLMPQ